jgi:hypothetical protein
LAAAASALSWGTVTRRTTEDASRLALIAAWHLRFRKFAARTIENEYLRNSFDVRDGADKIHMLLAMSQGRCGSLILYEIRSSSCAEPSTMVAVVGTHICHTYGLARPSRTRICPTSSPLALSSRTADRDCRTVCLQFHEGKST